MFYGLNKFLKKVLPKRLFYRPLIIVAAPIIILQFIITGVFFDSLWIKSNKGMTRSLAGEVKTIFDIYKENNIKTLIPLVFSNNHFIRNKKEFKHLVLFPNKRIRGKQKFIFLINRIAFLIALQKKDFDIVHPTYYDTYFLKYIGNKKLVLTVYDMIHEKFYQDKISEKKRLLCERADLIIAISENTKQDLIEIFNIIERLAFFTPFNNFTALLNWL